MSLFTRLISRRFFMQELGMIAAITASLKIRFLRSAPAKQALQVAQGYGAGAYGQAAYVGTPATKQTFLPLISEKGQ